ncbi:class I SAM-dependent RNA methyltransferase [bacterium]|nr:class I SAM-dependent RNA methyltransferase [bacterium]
MTTDKEILQLKIEKLITGGDGLARHEGKAIFVPGVIPGETVWAKTVLRKKGFARSEVVEIIEASEDRIEPPLGDIGTASGCGLQHMNIDAQRRAKREIVLDCFKRQAGVEIDNILVGPQAIGQELGYRNKVRITRNDMGFWGVIRQGTHDVIPIEEHGLMPELFNKTILPWLITAPPAEQASIRLDGQGGSTVAFYAAPSKIRTLKAVIKDYKGEPPYEGCVGITFNNKPVWGRDHILVRLAGCTWRVHAGSFFQINYAVASHAIDTLKDWMKQDEIGGENATLADLYSGVGLFALALGDNFGKVIAVEDDKFAIADLKNNISRKGGMSDKSKVIRGDVEKVTKQWKFETPGILANGCVIVDPPRSGLGKHVTNDLRALAPKNIFYMSCDPATLARDCKELAIDGYTIKRAEVLDMFPQTGHVETLVQLVK